MGRYSGEDYKEVPACSPENHRWGMNGNCFVCRRSKDSLIAEAKRILVLAENGKFGRYGG